MQDLCGMLAGAVGMVPDRPFFITPDDRVTYAEFDERSDRLAAVLRGHGMSVGDPIGILLPSGLELALTYWACQKVGGVAVMLNPMYREYEIAGAVATSGIQTLVTDVSRQLQVGEAERLALEILSWDEPGPGSVAAMLASADPASPPAHAGLDDPVCMFLTSGTTGRPKAVVQTQRNQMTALSTMFAYYGLRFGAEVCLNTMPLFNNFGVTGVMNLSVFAGASMISTARWDPVVALEMITQHSATAIWGTPTIYIDLCEKYDAAHHCTSSIRRAIASGAPSPDALIERFRALTGVRLAQVYGATETTGAVTGEPFVGRSRRGTVGRPVGGSTVAIVDENGKSVTAGTVGEIRVAGDLVSPGYAGDPDSQAAAFSGDGWASGDLGYLDEDDFLFLVGRKKEMIISGGSNIYPAEIEALLAQHESVATCAVIGVSDQRRGEVPIAVVVCRAGASQVSETDIIDFCAQRLSAYKVPRAVYFTDTLPLGPTGKVLRPILRDRYEEIHGAGTPPVSS